MSGHKNWRDIQAQGKADPKQVARYRRELEAELTLAELRKAREMTQVQLAAALDATQPGISKIERQTDLYLSTLRSYVQALGGELDLIAVFPDGVVPIASMAALEDAGEAVPA
jgi:transcriptional regulator with XRE-family HTH domain